MSTPNSQPIIVTDDCVLIEDDISQSEAAIVIDAPLLPLCYGFVDLTTDSEDEDDVIPPRIIRKRALPSDDELSEDDIFRNQRPCIRRAPRKDHSAHTFSIMPPITPGLLSPRGLPFSQLSYMLYAHLRAEKYRDDEYRAELRRHRG